MNAKPLTLNVLDNGKKFEVCNLLDRKEVFATVFETKFDDVDGFAKKMGNSYKVVFNDGSVLYAEDVADVMNKVRNTLN